MESSKKSSKKSSQDRARKFLIKAVNDDNPTIIKRIIDAGFDINEPIRDFPYATLLMYAATEGQEEALKQIIKLNPDVTKCDTSGRNVLHMTMSAGQMGTLAILMEDPKFECLHESRTIGGLTPLMTALQCSNIYAVGECLNAGMNPFAYDRLGQTAYEYAAPYRNINGQDM